MATWNPWDPATMPTSGAWQNWDPTMTPTQYYGTDSGDVPAPSFALDPNWLKTLGFTGAAQDNNQFNQQNGNQSATTSPELINWLNNNGYKLQLNSTLAGTPGASSKQLGRLVDSQGNQIGQGQQWGEDNGDAFMLAALGATGFAGAAALGAGAAGAGAGADAGASGGGLAGTGLPEYSAYGGAGSGGTLTASSDAGLGGALGSGTAAPTTAAGIDSAAGTAGYGASSAGIGGGVGDLAGIAGPTAGGAAAGGGLLGSSGGLLGSGISAGQAAQLAGAAGGLLANGSGLNSATQTTQNKVDPRIAQYIYGADGNSGLLGGVNRLYQQQMATGGLNPLQQQGIAAQQAVLQNPNYTQGFDQMKSAGMGLLSQPIAGNPFSNGQRSLAPSSPQSLMQAGANFIPPNVGIGQPRTGIQPVGLLGRQ